jgi:hypothetical protein
MFILNFPIMAQEIITDRPDQTESSSTIPKGSLQIESGVMLSFVENDGISLRVFSGPTTLFRYGLTKDIEIRIVNQYIHIKNKTNSKEISGIADLEVGAKIQILKRENINTEIAFLSHLVVPTGSKDLSFEKFGTINKLSISHQLNDRINLGYNFGYNNFGIGNGFLTYSIALGVSVTERMAVYVEPYGEIGIFDEHLANFDAGITYLLQDNFQLDFSFGTGLNYTMNYISAGFSWNIMKKKINKNKQNI